MKTEDTKNCPLSSEKYYSKFDGFQNTDSLNTHCEQYKTIFQKFDGLQNFCLKLVSNLDNLIKKENSDDLMNECTYLNFWTQYNVIDMVQGNSSIVYITLLHAIWTQFIEAADSSKKNICSPKYFPFIGLDYIKKWKIMHDYIENYENLKNVITINDNCKENYCKYFIEISNVHEEFEQVCNTEMNQKRCPDFWGNFKKNYEESSEILSKCKAIFNELGFYKVKVSIGDPGEEIYVEQYVSSHTFSFIEKLLGISIGILTAKSLRISKFVIAPIILILLFYFFMKKLSFFGSKISPRVDNMRKMWINVQGVTNPATLLNPMKPPGGGNKMGLPYMPK
ncbi:PIR Superfamily Protein [Plasmodium ovale curtisi]|uniref:PIR Superfamily Protein n=1 Tax=Plasmodium ovale curtisi TaxID=864141 RepID=A0A1A8X2H2_PLAOA|nr:PIR Superfamily Protein [Plasmodium ovale curtisi]SBS99432.1 PIR Superfamily Protein [Plasmodium ovale curtisi]